MSLSPGSTKNIQIVFIYSCSSRQDENLRQDLDKHLSTLKDSGVFMQWCKYSLDTSHFSDHKNNHNFNILRTSDVVALLVNPQLISLIQNTTSFSTEIQWILQQGKQEEIIVVPLLIREVHGWEKVLDDFNPLPKSRIAVKKSSDTDGAFAKIAEGLEEIIEKLKQDYQKLQEYRQIFSTAIQKEYPLSAQTLNTLIRLKPNLEFKNKDIGVIEQEITAQAEQEYNQKLQRYKQEFFMIIPRSNSVSEQEREKLKTIQNDLNLKDKVVARIESEVTETIYTQPIQRLIGYENQATSNVIIAISVIVVAALLGFCNSFSETQFTNLENQGKNKLEINPKNIDYMKRGNDHYSQKNYQAAIKDYTQAIQIAPKNADAYIKRGHNRHLIKDYQAAIKDYNQAIQIAPKNVNAYRKRGDAQYPLKKYQAAIDDYTKAIRLSPDSVDAYKSRGFVYENNLQNKQEAIKDYQKIATIYKKQGATDKYRKINDKIQKLQQRKPQSSN
ncbi:MULTISPECIES: tetratricopeptide repeat protein [unclassified Nostoc]|uniref:tetratricopeptide repeat protein n=1 Tax=unclassified Nostoc TaxID=2593658 RepID=UPI002605DAFC|nr:tetratricopeptide repeat protein [Nostoc sp. S13]MDF5740144.1 tetratricopeptide repeat protein [Nostoc sp. S13]